MRISKFLFVASLLMLSCDEEAAITFSEENSLYEDNAVIEINIPKADGDSDLSNSINSTLETHIADMLSFSEVEESSNDLKTAIGIFDQEYSKFKEEIDEESLAREAIFDAEVIYQSSEVISVAINSYLNTGGAHGNMNITLYNFDGQDGDLLTLDDIVKDQDALTEFVRPYFEKAIKEKRSSNIEEYFFDEGFHLPANIGLNDDGVLFLYNIYEIGPYAFGMTEFTIPFDDIQTFLLLQ